GRPDAEVLDHRHRPEARRVAGAKVAVDIGPGEARVTQRPEGALGMDLRHGQVRRVACRVLVSPDDVGFALQAHLSPSSRVIERARDRGPGGEGRLVRPGALPGAAPGRFYFAAVGRSSTGARG